MKYLLGVLFFQFLLMIGYADLATAKSAQKAVAKPEAISCPHNISQTDCDAFKSGYTDAREDHKIMGLVESGNWKNDSNDPPAYKAGYEAGWRSK